MGRRLAGLRTRAGRRWQAGRRRAPWERERVARAGHPPPTEQRTGADGPQRRLFLRRQSFVLWPAAHRWPLGCWAQRCCLAWPRGKQTRHARPLPHVLGIRGYRRHTSPSQAQQQARPQAAVVLPPCALGGPRRRVQCAPHPACRAVVVVPGPGHGGAGVVRSPGLAAYPCHREHERSVVGWRRVLRPGLGGVSGPGWGRGAGASGGGAAGRAGPGGATRPRPAGRVSRQPSLTKAHRVWWPVAARVVLRWVAAVGPWEARPPASVSSHPTRVCRRRRTASARASLPLFAAPET
jgi:hypothetical protein